MPPLRSRPSIFRPAISIAFIVLTLLFGAGWLVPVSAQTRQLSLADILIALRSKKTGIDEKNRLLAEAVRSRGITFAPTPEIEKELVNTGANDGLLDSIRTKVKPTEALRVPTPEPAPQPTTLAKAPLPDFSFYRNRANRAIAENRDEAAIADLAKALDLKPKDAGTYFARALAYIRLEKQENSLKDLDKVVELDNKNATARYIRGQVNEKLGRSDLALTDYARAAELDPTDHEAAAAASRLRAVIAVTAKSQEDRPPTVSRGDTNSVSVGVLNYYAVYLERPIYSKTDRSMRLQGRVTVNVTLNEQGKVVSATAVEGPPQLRTASENAVRRSRFNPVHSGTKAVRATGYVVYNFHPDQ